MNNRIPPHQPQAMQTLLQVQVTCMCCLGFYFVSKPIPPGMAFIPPAKHQLRGCCTECDVCPVCSTSKRSLMQHATPDLPHAAFLCIECGHHWHGPEHPPEHVPPVEA